jgi:Mg-chelatase subunit ChlD
MNLPPHSTPPEELESRITALLLGELNPQEAEETRRLLEQDPELTRLHHRLQQTIGLVREAIAQPSEGLSDGVGRLQFSEERRRALLARLGKSVPAPVEAVTPRLLPWLVPMSLAAGLIALIGVMLLIVPSRQVKLAAVPSEARTNDTRLDVRYRIDAPRVPAADLTSRGFERTAGDTGRAVGDGESIVDIALGRTAVHEGVQTLQREPSAMGGPVPADRLMMERYGIAPSPARPQPVAPPLVRKSRSSPTTPALGGERMLGRGITPEAPMSAGAVALPRLESRRVQESASALEWVEADGGSAGYLLYSAPLESEGALLNLERTTRTAPLSTFSLNVSDVSFKLAASSLERGRMPDPSGIRVEEFVNAFDYRDPQPALGMPLAFAHDVVAHPFAHNRDLIRFSLKTAAQGREPGRSLNLVVLLDNSGSMERADRVAIVREALGVLSHQLEPNDRISVVAFARTPRLWVDALPGDRSDELLERVGNLTPQGGTDLEAALELGYETARRHYLPGGMNRVILLTDGAANLGNTNPEALRQIVERNRLRGIALDTFGIGWEGYNDDLLETLVRHGDGRYGFLNAPEEASAGFADQLAGALQIAAADVKVQVEFNPDRVLAYRQVGYDKHQLTQEQFRDPTVDAAELGAAETGTALYTLQVDPQGRGPIGHVRVRYKVPVTGEYQEHEWLVSYPGRSQSVAEANPAMRLAVVTALFGEWLGASPLAAEVTPHALLALLQGVPEAYEPDARPARLEWMIRQAQRLGQ